MSVCVIPPSPNPDRPRYSRHSRARMAELHVSENLVVETLRSPLVTQPGGSEHHNGAVVYTGRKIRVVADPVTATVITVQLRTFIPYIHGVHTLDNLPNPNGSRN